MRSNKRTFKGTVKNYVRKNKAFLCIVLLLCLFSVALIIFTANDCFLYPGKTIVQITEVDEQPDHTEYSVDGEHSETVYLQTVRARVVYGDETGKEIEFTNLRTESNVYDTRYRCGDKLFVHSEDDGSWTVENVKRDTYVVAMLAITVVILFIVGRRKGVLAVVSVAVNAAVFWFCLKAYLSGANLLAVCIGAAAFFTVVCLTLIGGFKRMTAIAVISTFAGAAVTFGITCIVIYGLDFKGLYVEGLEYLIIATDYRVTFMSELLIGGLGATMDIAMSISSALCELKEKDPDISFKALLRSGREIGKDITGTMTNVLLFTFLCGGIPLMMVIVRSGVPMLKYVFGNSNLEIARFLVGSIGIVLTVPISCFVASSMLSRKKGKGKEAAKL